MNDVRRMAVEQKMSQKKCPAFRTPCQDYQKTRVEHVYTEKQWKIIE